MADCYPEGGWSEATSERRNTALYMPDGDPLIAERDLDIMLFLKLQNQSSKGMATA